jgi:hypothetical protein
MFVLNYNKGGISMIKMVFRGDPYNYGASGKQEYGVDTTIEVNGDASLDQVVEAMAQIAKIAGYSEISIPRVLRNVADEMEFDLKDTARIINNAYPDHEEEEEVELLGCDG